MCTLALAYNKHPEYPFIFIGNRDEFYKRLTEPAQFRGDILCGLDLEKGGTWTGMSRTGRMAFITNHRNFTLHVAEPESRGLLTKNYLEGNMPAERYLKMLSLRKTQFNPYNLIVGDLNGLYFYSNIEDTIIKLEAGIHGLSNALLNTPWPKVQKIKTEFSKVVFADQIEEEALFKMLENRERANENDLPATGLEQSLETALSAIFIELEAYGTRHETVILINRHGCVRFIEKFRKEDGTWERARFEFKITSTT